MNKVKEGDGLYADEYEPGKYTYKGINPNNYITFNNETWRIISKDSSGLIKIMRNESVEVLSWNANEQNNWETATLNTYLNGEYLNSLLDQDKIVSHTWSIGKITNYSDLAGQIDKESETKNVSVNVGLITASEYLRANSNVEQCGQFNLNNTNNTICLTTNWMYSIVLSGDSLWTISSYANNTSNVIIVRGNSSNIGMLAFSPSGMLRGVVPVIYLNSDIVLTGDGSQGNPYIITN